VATPPPDSSLHCASHWPHHQPPHEPLHQPLHQPLHRTRRRLIAGLGAITMAVPLSFALAGSSQAAPTLTIAQAKAQLAALQTREDAADEAYDQGNLASQQAASALASAQTAVTAQGSKLASMETSIDGFAAASYTSGGLNPVDTLLAGGSPQLLLSRAASMNEIARNQDSALLKISAQREVLSGAQQTASDKAAAAKTALANLASARKQITGVIAQEQAVLAHLQAQARAELLAEQARAQAASRAEARAALHQALTAPAAPATTQVTSASAGAGASAPTTPVPSAGGAARIALEAAYSQMGKPYAYGAAGPSSYDCSGLVMWAYAHAGISLPHSAAGQYGYGTHVSESQLEPGDLVFYDEGSGIGHVGIYVGGGEMIDANHTGGWVGVRPLYSGLVGGTRL
jgi:cell wall-associated NlpC family hydrolase